jgi:ABC-type Fe3+/spermidine/putrescine transport system ATPase subunit
MADRIAVMRHGQLVQVGTPHELYTRPESAFAAEFIGGTNLLPGTLEEVGELLAVKTAVGLLRAKSGVTGLGRGEPVVCSVRPESLHLKRAEGPSPIPPSDGTNELSGEVQSIMYLGDSEQYSLRLADSATVRAVDYRPTTRKAQVGERVAVQFDARDVVVLRQEEWSE